MEIYNFSKEGITWVDIDAYSRCRKLSLKQTEIDYIIQCSKWANSEIMRLKDEEED